MKYQIAKFISFTLVTAFLISTVPPAKTASAAAAPLLVQTDQAGTALQQGRTLLKRGQTAEALGYLQTALNLYTTSKNARGIGAAHNELGDLYLRQGQHKVALEHFQKAYVALAGASLQEQQAGAAAGGAGPGRRGG